MYDSVEKSLHTHISHTAPLPVRGVLHQPSTAGQRARSAFCRSHPLRKKNLLDAILPPPCSDIPSGGLSSHAALLQPPQRSAVPISKRRSLSLLAATSLVARRSPCARRRSSHAARALAFFLPLRPYSVPARAGSLRRELQLGFPLPRRSSLATASLATSFPCSAPPRARPRPPSPDVFSLCSGFFLGRCFSLPSPFADVLPRLAVAGTLGPHVRNLLCLPPTLCPAVACPCPNAVPLLFTAVALPAQPDLPASRPVVLPFPWPAP